MAMLGTLLFVSGFLASCSNQTASGQHATVVMRDGSTVTGTVTATSASEISFTGAVGTLCYELSSPVKVISDAEVAATLTGTVTATSASEISLTGDDNAKHTVPTAQVKSIEYD